MLIAYKMVGGILVFFGNADKFRSKMASYGDYHLNIPEITDNIEEKIEKGLDPLGRSNILTTVPLDDSFPEYIINNQDKYMEFIKL